VKQSSIHVLPRFKLAALQDGKFTDHLTCWGFNFPDTSLAKFSSVAVSVRSGPSTAPSFKEPAAVERSRVQIFDPISNTMTPCRHAFHRIDFCHKHCPSNNVLEHPRLLTMHHSHGHRTCSNAWHKELSFKQVDCVIRRDDQSIFTTPLPWL
jgi:hypothetical protein